MQLVLHAGAHFTEENRLIKCLLRNKDILHDRGVIVPGPGKYKTLLREAVIAGENSEVSPTGRDVLLDAMLDGERADRLLLSSAHVLGWPRAAIRKGVIYPQAADRMAQLAKVFHNDEIELFIAVRNPATFVPACFEKNPGSDILDFLGGIDPRHLKWSHTFGAIREAAPEIPITVWCNEEAPFLWSQIIREIGGLEHFEEIVGGFDLFANIISREGMERFTAYVASKPDMTEIHLRRVMAAFLEKFVLEDKVEEVVDLPGWTVEMVSEMTDIYEEDISAIARIPGVEMITL